MQSEHNLVGRTAVITCGELAQAAGERLELLLSEREGPKTAVAILHQSDSQRFEMAELASEDANSAYR